MLFTFNPVGVGSYIFHNSIGFTYGYLRFTPLGLGIDVDMPTPKGLNVKLRAGTLIATGETGGTLINMILNG